MPPGGPSSYGSGHENARPKRFNFPSTPSKHVGAQSRDEPPRAPRQQPPQQRQQPPRYDDGRFERQLRAALDERQFDQGPPPRIQPVQPAPRDYDGQNGRIEQQPLVRPYAMTGGRTRPRYQLAIEALVHTSAEPAKLQGSCPSTSGSAVCATRSNR